MMLGYFLLTIAALISIFRTPHDRAASKFWWSALVIVIPVGTAARFLFGAPPLRRRGQADPRS